MANRKPTTSPAPTPTADSRGLSASVRFIRIGPRKVRLLADQLRGLPLDAAIEQLRFVRKSASAPMEKLLRSAAANLTQAGQFSSKDVTIGAIMVNEGPKLKRYMPRAHGRATTVLQRMCHITVTLKPAAKSETSATKPVTATEKSATVASASAKKSTPRKKAATSKTVTPTA